MRNHVAIALAILALSTAFIIVEPRSAVAHDCGLECIDCGWSSWEGDSSTHDEYGQEHFDCTWFDCDNMNCVMDPLVKDEAAAAAELADAMDILRAVAAAPVGEMDAVVEEHADRLVLHPARGLVTVRGTACNPGALTSAVVFLSPEKLTALEELGAEMLVELLATYSD